MQQFGFVNILIGLLETLEIEQANEEVEESNTNTNKHEQSQQTNTTSLNLEDLSTLLAQTIANLSGRFASHGTKRSWKFLDNEKNEKLSLIIHEPSFLSSDVGSLVCVLVGILVFKEKNHKNEKQRCLI